MTYEELKEGLAAKKIENADLSALNLDEFDFSECEISNTIFAKENQKERQLCNINFQNATLEHVIFDGAKLDHCNFDGEFSQLHKCSFKRCELKRCRFRKTTIEWSDFRYVEVNIATFESSKISFCDFYRALFMGIVIFRKSKIENCSFYYSYFDEGATLRRENLTKDRILQQNKNDYRRFLVEWNTYGPGVRKNEQNRESDWNPDESLKNRFDDAEDIYKTLNGLWMSKGFLGDANWAYVKGRKMERRRMIAEMSNSRFSFGHKLRNTGHIAWNFISDLMFGYGESMRKMILSYFIMVILFAYLYYSSPDVSLATYTHAIGVSLKNMVAITPEEVSNISPFIDFLNVIQTTIGIIITGIFGFILGNKIRNQ
jgi:uncharacterized protein YjbI with pentapeptide repeats